jgi:hypothetical protein
VGISAETLSSPDQLSPNGSLGECATSSISERRRRPQLTAIVPTRNEAPNVGALVREAEVHPAGIEAEVLFVDDSNDDTPLVIRGRSRPSTERGIS